MNIPEWIRFLFTESAEEKAKREKFNRLKLKAMVYLGLAFAMTLIGGLLIASVFDLFK